MSWELPASGCVNAGGSFALMFGLVEEGYCGRMQCRNPLKIEAANQRLFHEVDDLWRMVGVEIIRLLGSCCVS